MRQLALAFTILLAIAAPAEAQKNCKKGIPCGNSCIAANKTCRIGSSSPTPSRTTAPAAPARLMGSAAADSAQWVGSSRGSTYYLRSCSGAGKLAAANRVYFKSEEEARAAGYRRSTQKGC